MKVLDDMHKKARANGLFMRQVCAEAGIAPAQFSRWRRDKVQPLYVSVVRLQEALDHLIAQRASASEAHPDTSPAPEQSVPSVTA